MEPRENVEGLIHLAKKMRAAQKRYFKTRDANVLNYARELEDEVDTARMEHDGIVQGELF